MKGVLKQMLMNCYIERQVNLVWEPFNIYENCYLLKEKISKIANKKLTVFVTESQTFKLTSSPIPNIKLHLLLHQFLNGLLQESDKLKLSENQWATC